MTSGWASGIVALICAVVVYAGERQDTRRHESPPEVVSIIRLIASPGAFNGKRVRVGGFCHLGFESEALYLHREDFMNRLSVNALKLDMSMQKGDVKQSDRYSIVEGVFAQLSADDPRPYGGAIRVETIEVIGPRDRER